jgi:hypothetical protein
MIDDTPAWLHRNLVLPKNGGEVWRPHRPLAGNVQNRGTDTCEAWSGEAWRFSGRRSTGPASSLGQLGAGSLTVSSASGPQTRAGWLARMSRRRSMTKAGAPSNAGTSSWKSRYSSTAAVASATLTP